MKKGFRFAAYLIAMLMVISSLIVPAYVLAEEEETVIEAFGVKTAGISYSTDESKSGERSIHINLTAETNLFKTTTLGVIKGQDYNISFDFKGNISRMYVRLNWTADTNAALIVNNALSQGKNIAEITGPDENGWYHFESTKPWTGAGDPALFVPVGTNNFYMDNLSITDTYGNELIFNGDFEDLGAYPSVKAFGGSTTTGVRYTSDVKHDGKRAVHLGCNNTTLFNVDTVIGLSDTATYNISFDFLGGMIKTYVRTGWTANKSQALIEGVKLTQGADVAKITGPDENGWYHFETTTPWPVTKGTPFLAPQGGVNSFYMDNLSITNSSTGDEMAIQGDFEEYTAGERVDYEPKNVLLTKANSNALMASWRNPAAPALSKVSLYETTTGEEVLIKDDFSTGADSICRYNMTDLDAGIHLYKLVFDFADSERVELALGKEVNATKDNTEHVGDWAIRGASTNAAAPDNPPVGAELDYDVYKTSAPSLRIFSNIKENVNNSMTTVTLHTTQDLVAGKTYRIKYSMTGNKFLYQYFRLGNYQKTIATPGGWNLNAPTTYGGWWKEYTRDVEVAGYTYGVQFSIVHPSEDIWIDDISIYELDDEGNPTGDNLFENVGTGDGLANTAELGGAKIGKNYSKGATVQWTKATDSTMAAVYLKDGDALKLRAYIPASLGSVNIDNLVNDTDAELVVRAVHNGIPSGGVTLTAHPTPDPVEFGDFKVTTAADGAKQVSVTVKNNKAGSGYTAHLILAAFDGNMMTRIAKANEAVTIPQTALGAEPVTLTETITLNQGETLKAFLWNSISGMTPLKPAQEFVSGE